MDNNPPKLKILTANVGNTSLRFRSKKFNLADKRVETRIRKNIQFFRPDIVAFQELLSPEQEDTPSNQHQVQRILGQEYSILCDSRTQYLALAVHQSIGKFNDEPAGYFGLAEDNFPAFNDCDPGFNSLAGELILYPDQRVTVVAVHLNSRDEECRIRTLKDIQDYLCESSSSKVLLLGDFNFDPWRDHAAKSVGVLAEMLKTIPGLKIHNTNGKDRTPEPTHRWLRAERTLDLILSNFLDGETIILGQTPGTQRLDGGKGTDHKAVLGTFDMIGLERR